MVQEGRPQTPNNPEITTHEYDAVTNIFTAVRSGVNRLTNHVPGVARFRSWNENDTGGHDITQWARMHPEQFPGFKLEATPSALDRLRSFGGKVLSFAQDVAGTIKEEFVESKNPES